MQLSINRTTQLKGSGGQGRKSRIYDMIILHVGAVNRRQPGKKIVLVDRHTSRHCLPQGVVQGLHQKTRSGNIRPANMQKYLLVLLQRNISIGMRLPTTWSGNLRGDNGTMPVARMRSLFMNRMKPRCHHPLSLRATWANIPPDLRSFHPSKLSKAFRNTFPGPRPSSIRPPAFSQNCCMPRDTSFPARCISWSLQLCNLLSLGEVTSFLSGSGFHSDTAANIDVPGSRFQLKPPCCRLCKTSWTTTNYSRLSYAVGIKHWTSCSPI
jgi:hypothetical protein